ncbi:hypothetical protein CVS40_12782 [Lucilia cuprina]|nr:hypothetical protein CVS40_12782 [Lucilia cuprina]
MNKHPYNLRQRKSAADGEISSGSEEIEYFDTSSVNMAEMENMLAQMQALQHEINTLRESQANMNDASRSNLQKFAQIERSFALCSITSDSDKFDLVSVRLEDEILLSIEDLITNPPQIDKFDKFDLVSVRLEDEILLSIEDLITNPPQIDKFGTLKEHLITKFAETSESKLRRLLQGCETAGKKTFGDFIDYETSSS